MRVKQKIIVYFALIVALNVTGVAFAEETSEEVPMWAYEKINDLIAKGYLHVPVHGTDLYTRDEMARLVAKAISDMERDAEKSVEGLTATIEGESEDTQSKLERETTLEKLKVEFTPELKKLGYFSEEKIKRDLRAGKRRQAKKPLTITGEIRYNYAFQDGAKGARFDDDSKLRTRVNFDYNFDHNWHLYSMLESNKALVGNSSANGKPVMERWYARGRSGITDVTAGSFGYAMAEGNIYDSTFQGIQGQFGDQVKYKASYGKIDEADEVYTLTANYQDYDYQLESGIYGFEMSNGERRNIWTVAGNYDFENFTVGAMYLNGNQNSKNEDGYVLTVGHGKLNTWRPGTYSLYAKYYDQPALTYVAHTMTGLGNRMQGFKGYGAGVEYTVYENLVAGLEYYDLEDKVTGEKGQTVWTQVTYYF